MTTFWGDDMATLGEYFAEFNAAAPKIDLGEEISILDVQKYLNRRGEKGANKKPLVEDGKWSNDTEFALRNFLAAYNRTNNSAATYQTLGADKLLLTGNVGKVIKAAVKLHGPTASAVAKPKPKTKASAKKKASAAKPTEPSKPGMAQVPVAQIQAVLKANGLKITADGSWGPTTQRLWQALAAKKGADPTINRAGPDSAWIVLDTLTRLSSPQQTASAIATTPSADIVVTVESLQKILKARGVTSFGIVDKKYGPKTAAAWSKTATNVGLSPAISRVTGTTARVSRATYEGLKELPPASTGTVPAPVAVPTSSTPTTPVNPVEPPALAPPSPTSTVAVILSVIQKAWNEAVLSKPDLGKSITVNGKWGSATQNALAKLIGATAAKAAKLNKKKTAVLLSPTLSEQLGTLASRYDSRSQAQVQQSAQSNTDVSMDVAKIQRALNAFNGRVDELLYPVTGAWDDKTKVGYMTMASIPVSSASGVDQRVSADRRSILGSPEVAKAVEVLAARWDAGRAAQAAQEAQAPAPPPPAPASQQQEQSFAPPVPEQTYAPPPMQEQTFAPPTQEPLPEPELTPQTPLAPVSEQGGGGNVGLIVGGLAVAAGLAYYAAKRKG